MIQRMGTRARSSTPDPFSSAPAREAHSQPPGPIGSPNAVPPRHVLPADLPNAVKQLHDQELEQLLSAVIAEQKRRGNKPPAQISRKLDRYGHLFPTHDDGTELAAAERALFAT